MIQINIFCNFLDRWGYGTYRKRENVFPKTHKRFEVV